MGRLTPVINSTFPFSIYGIQIFVGVPPSRSVKIRTPFPSSTSLIASVTILQSLSPFSLGLRDKPLTLTSNTSSLAEVVEHKEMMFDPNNIEEIVEKAIEMLRDPACRKNNLEKGAQNVKRFSWKQSAKKLIDIYNSL